MNLTTLINVADIKGLTRIGPNFSDEALNRAVLKAQRRELKPIIGKNLMQKFIDDVDSSTALTGEYKILFDDYIYPFLVACTEYWVTKDDYSDFSDNGLGKLSGSAAYNPLSDAEFNRVIDGLEEEMDYYGKPLAEYVRSKGSSTFAELSATTTIESDEADLVAPRNRSPLILKRRQDDNYKK